MSFITIILACFPPVIHRQAKEKFVTGYIKTHQVMDESRLNLNEQRLIIEPFHSGKKKKPTVRDNHGIIIII